MSLIRENWLVSFAAVSSALSLRGRMNENNRRENKTIQ